MRAIFVLLLILRVFSVQSIHFGVHDVGEAISNAACTFQRDGYTFSYSGLTKQHMDYVCNQNCSSDGLTYHINVCRDVMYSNCTAAGKRTPLCQETVGGEFHSCGTLENPIVSLIDYANVTKGLRLTYVHGDLCHAGTPLQRNRTSSFFFECASSNRTIIDEITGDIDDCHYDVYISSPYGCPNSTPTPSSSSTPTSSSSTPTSSSSTPTSSSSIVGSSSSIPPVPPMHCCTRVPPVSDEILHYSLYKSSTFDCHSERLGYAYARKGACYNFFTGLGPRVDTCDRIEACFANDYSIGEYNQCIEPGVLAYSMMWCSDNCLAIWDGESCTGEPVDSIPALNETSKLCTASFPRCPNLRTQISKRSSPIVPSSQGSSGNDGMKTLWIVLSTVFGSMFIITFATLVIVIVLVLVIIVVSIIAFAVIFVVKKPSSGFGKYAPLPLDEVADAFDSVTEAEMGDDDVDDVAIRDV